MRERFPPGVGNFNFHPPVGADLCVCPDLRVCPRFRICPGGRIRNHQDLNRIFSILVFKGQRTGEKKRFCRALLRRKGRHQSRNPFFV